MAAALFVFFGHFATHTLPTLPSVLAFHGREAVAIFFVLSGFVIRFVTRNKEKDGRSYAVARASRISSVVLPSIALTIILDWIGRGLSPIDYVRYAPIGIDGLPSLLASMTFTNEIWFNHIILGSNEPYWSMGFEIWYYAIFGVVLYCRGPLRVLLLAASALLLGPKILLYMALWLLGVALYDVISGLKPFTYQRIFGWALVLISATSYLLAHETVGSHVESVFRVTSVASVLVSFGYFFFVAVLTAAVILGLDLALWDTDCWSRPVADGIKWLAGGSFTLYLTHQPLLLFWGAVFPTLRGWFGGSLAIAALTLISVYVVAELGERRKRQFRSLVEKLIPHETCARVVVDTKVDR